MTAANAAVELTTEEYLRRTYFDALAKLCPSHPTKDTYCSRVSP